MAAPSARALRDHLDGRWAATRRRAREVASDPRLRFEVPDGVDAHRARTLAQLHVLAEGDYPRLGFPREYGGLDDLGASLTGFEMLAMGDASLLVKAGVQWGLFGGAILRLGTARQHAAYLPGAISLELLGCFAMTESGHGSDVASLATTATYDPGAGAFDLHTPSTVARKDFIGNAARDASLAVVFAQLITGGVPRGVHALVVPIRDSAGAPAPGVRIADCGPKAGLNGVDNGRLSFDHVRVPRENLLDRFGSVSAAGVYTTPIRDPARRFFTMLGTLVQGRVSICGAAVSAAKLALAIAIRYGERREQFGAPDGRAVTILDYRAHQRRLLPELATTYALHFAQAGLVADLCDDEARDTNGRGAEARDAGGDVAEAGRRELEARAAGLKAVATWHAAHTARHCREACGGAGYMSENRLPSLRADVDVYTTFEGDNTVLLQLLGRELLTGYRDHVGELDWLGTIRLVAEQALGMVAETTGARRVLSRLVDASAPPGDDAPVRDRSWQLRMFDFREQHLLETLARRLRRVADAKPAEQFAMVNDAQDHLILAARAHVDAVLLDAFAGAIADCGRADLAALLNPVCDLYALARIESERGWYAEHGRLPGKRAKAVIAEVNALCGELRPNARLLVDAFGVPEALLDLPLLREVE